jgi:hypothetical protein
VYYALAVSLLCTPLSRSRHRPRAVPRTRLLPLLLVLDQLRQLRPLLDQRGEGDGRLGRRRRLGGSLPAPLAAAAWAVALALAAAAAALERAAAAAGRAGAVLLRVLRVLLLVLLLLGSPDLRIVVVHPEGGK